VTSAKPKIADYPFTTLEPVLGVVEHKGNSFVMVDIPGLIEGAHQGVGLGHEFLRHVQRTRVLVHVIDGSTGDIMGTYSTIRRELEMYGRKIETKPEIIGINKKDIPGTEERSTEILRELNQGGQRAHLVSAITRQGLENLLDDVIERLNSETNEVTPTHGRGNEEKQIVLKPKPIDSDKISIVKRDKKFVVYSQQAARIAETVDPTNWEARIQLYEQLRRMGIASSLEKAGIRAGDIFKIGSFEMKWGME
jgi:GTP-binding protein